MCGIAGVLVTRGRRTEETVAATERMATAMRTRGPDNAGLWMDESVALAHRRLAIIDLDARANQPMHSADGRYTIVFNGEIYNHRALRVDLEADGVALHTRSDTEVLLALFARDGAAMLPLLRGMFAFAIWDAQTRSLFIARDPYGIKPLYYAHTASGFVFASQVKALLRSGYTSSEREPAGLASFLLWGSVVEPWTTYREVYALPAGHFLRVDERTNHAIPVPWSDVTEHWRSQPATDLHDMATVQARVRNSLAESIALHSDADVPICMFLSGGVDSTMLAAMLAARGKRPLAITLAFSEFADTRDDESGAAALIARRYGLEHVIHQVTRAEFEADMPRILAAMDQPSIDGINSWFASKVAASQGYKVALSGIGGDELFCGYPSFTQIARAQRIASFASHLPGAANIMRAPLRAIARWRRQPKLALVGDQMGSIEGLYFLKRGLFAPAELARLLPEDIARTGLARLGGDVFGLRAVHARNALASVAALESSHYLRHQLLRDSDWASMAHSLELRTPFVDATLALELAPYTDAFANRAGKHLQANAPVPALPNEVLARPKTGFGLPMAQWLETQPPLPESLRALATHWSRSWAWRITRSAGMCA